MHQNQRLAVLLGVTALVAPLAATPAQAATPLQPVSSALTQQKAALGKKSSKDLNARVKRARTAYDQRRWCLSVKELSGVVKATKRYKTPGKSTAGAAIADEARAAQGKIFSAHAKKTKSCGLPAPRLAVGNVPHETKTIPSADGKGTRQVSALSGNAKMEFVSDEIIVVSNDAAAVERFAKRWKGSVIEHHDVTRPGGEDTWLLRIDASKADTSGLSADLRQLDPAARGNAKLSDGKGLRLLAVAADAATRGVKVSLNTLLDSTAVEDRWTTEAPMNGETNAYTRWYNDPAGVIQTGEAWRTLRISGADQKRVKLAVVDGGFATTNGTLNDFSAGRSGDWGQGANNMTCGGGAACQWHGTNVASTAAGVPDNGLGVAGTGGQVADVQAVHLAGATMFDAIDGIYEAFEADARIINMSLSGEMDAIVSFIQIPYEDATQTARENGALVVAAAGNDGRDVDAEDCFIVCWEEEWIAPCENDAVVCVGGITADRRRDPGSNYGYEWTENAKTSDVDLFAPFTTWVGPDGGSAANQRVSGTSFSAPFVSGIAAMMLAADPSLTPAELEKGLKETATSSPDKHVSRIVQADAAVKWAFPSSQFPPLVTVDPSTETSGAYGGFTGVKLKAKIHTVYDTPSCCSVSWSSDQDGVLGSGLETNGILSSAGPRTVTVKATNAAGQSDTDTVEIIGTNQGPSVGLVKPTVGEKLYRGMPAKFEAKPSDPNQFGGVACSSVSWEITGAGVPTLTGTGCQPQFTFPANGTRQVRVTVKDEAGASSSVIQSIQIVDPPLNAPPVVSILQPDEDSSLDPDKSYTLKASAIDPDATETPAGVWTVKVNGTTTQIGTGNQISWEPGTTIPFSCGGDSATLIFSATDSHGTSTDEIEIYVPYPVC